jgi:hypothetical protein
VLVDFCLRALKFDVSFWLSVLKRLLSGILDLDLLFALTNRKFNLRRLLLAKFVVLNQCLIVVGLYNF